MKEPPTIRAKPARLRRASTWLVLGLVVCAAAAWLARARLLSFALRRAAHSAGIDVAWDRVEVEGARLVRIVGVDARRGADIDLAADEIVIVIEPLRILRGDWSGLREVRVDGLRGRAGPFEKREATGSSGIQLPLSITLPKAEITTRALEFGLAGGRRLAVDGLALAFDGSQARAESPALAWIDNGARVEFPLSLRGSYRSGRFEIERATWDPRLVFENALLDLDDALLGVVRFEGAVRAFDGEARVRGRVDENVLHLTANVEGLDAGAAARAYLPSLATDARGLVDLVLDAAVPLGDPIRAEWNVRVEGRDLHWKRSLDGLSFRARTLPGAILVEDGVVTHGDNMARFEGRLPPLASDRCAWLKSVQVSAEAALGDVRSLLARDIGLTLRGEAAWNHAPVRVRALLLNGVVVGRVRSEQSDVGAIVAAFAGTTPITGAADLDVEFELDLFRPAQLRAEGDVFATDMEFWGRTLDALTTRAAFGPRSVELNDLFADAGRNRVGAEHVFLPRRVLSGDRIDQLQALVVTGLEAELGDIPLLLGAVESEANIGPLSAHRAVFSGELSDGVVRLSQGLLDTDAGTARITRGRVPLYDDLALVLADPVLDVDLQVSFEDFAGAITTLAPGVFDSADLPHGAVVGSAHVRGAAPGPTASLDLGARDVLVRGVLLQEVGARLDLDQRELRVSKLDATGTIGSFSLTGAYVFAERRLVDAHLSADLVDLSRLAPSDMPSGKVQVEVRANGTVGDLLGQVDLRGTDLTYRGARIDAIDLSARAASGSWTIDRAVVRGHGLQVDCKGRVSSLDPEATSRTIIVDALDIEVTGARATSKTPITITQTSQSWSIDRVELEGEAGRLLMSFHRADDVSTLDVEASARLDGEFQQLVDFGARGAEVDARLHAVLRGRDLAVESSGTIVAQPVGNEPGMRAEWAASLAERVARIERLSITRGVGLAGMRVQASGQFPIDLLGDEPLHAGPLALRLGIAAPDVSIVPFVPQAWAALGSIDLNADLQGTWSALLGTIDVHLDEISASGAPALAGLGSISGDLRFALDQRVRLDAADLALVETASVRAAGSLAVPLDLRELLRGDFGRLLDAPLDLAVRLEAQDLGPLAKRFPALRRTRGEVQADARATGTLRAPRWTGEGTLAEGEIRTTSNLPPVVGVTSRVHFDREAIVIDDLVGEMGGAPFAMRGRIDLVGELPVVALNLEGSSLLLWRERDVTVRADAKLSLAGPLDALVLSGDLALRDGRYTKKFDFLSVGKRGPRSAGTRGLRLFALDEPPFSTMRFDVQVKTATPFTISSNVVRGIVSPSLALLGTGALPELRGQLLVGPSRVLLPSGALKVRTGRIEFRPDRPDVPDLDIQATARLQGYDIEVNVSGSYDDPRIELSSVPPLPREDLALLLITGRPPGNTLSGAGQRAAFDIAVYIARDVAAAWFESDEDEVESLAERLEVVLGADTTKSGADAFLVRLRLFGDLTTERSAIFATGERDIYDFYNFGLRFVFAFE